MPARNRNGQVPYIAIHGVLVSSVKGNYFTELNLRKFISKIYDTTRAEGSVPTAPRHYSIIRRVNFSCVIGQSELTVLSSRVMFGGCPCLRAKVQFLHAHSLALLILLRNIKPLHCTCKFTHSTLPSLPCPFAKLRCLSYQTWTSNEKSLPGSIASFSS